MYYSASANYAGTGAPWSANTPYTINFTNLPASGPEIAVSGSIGGAVDDGQTSAQGNQTVGTPVTVTYTVTNTGNANLILAKATDSSPSSNVAGINITDPGSTTVAGGGGTTTFQVTYTPNATGAFSFNLSFTNNDSDENPFNFTISGTGVAPAPVLTVSATPSAAEQTVGRTYSFTVTPGAAAGGGDTSGSLTLTTTLPVNQFFTGSSGAGWSCIATSNSPDVVSCTSSTAISAGSNGNPVTISVTPAAAILGGFIQPFTLSGGGASSSASGFAASVKVNGQPQTKIEAASTTLPINQAASFTPVTRTSGGTAGFTWSISPALPAGLSIDSTTGTISGTPTVASAAADYNVTVTDARGATSSNLVSIAVQAPAAAPTVTTVSPALGSTAGGTLITITGTNFTGVTGVSFGGTPAASFSFVSATQITATSPAGAAGTVNVTVTTASGTSANNGTADDFEYGTAPTRLFDFIVANRAYDNIEPPVSTSGFFDGVRTGYYLGLSGTDTSVSIAGGVISIDSSGVLSFARPAGFRGEATVSVRAYNAFGESQRLPVTFKLLDPTLVSSLSGSGAQQGVALSGYSIGTTGGMAPYSCATTPATGSLPAGVSINADCTLSGTPTQNGTFDFTLDVTDSSVGPGAGSASAPNPFTQRSGTLSLVVAPPPVPVVTGVSPAAGPTAGGTAVTITGTNFTGATKVTFGTTDVPAANFTSITDKHIVVNSPAAASDGTVTVSVTAPGGTSANNGTADDFTYALPPASTAAFSVNSIPADNSTRTVVTVDVTNPNTTAVLTNLRATLSMPAGLAYVSGTASINPGSATGVSGTVNGSGTFFTMLIGSLPPGVSVTLRFEARSSIVGSYSVTTNPVTSSAGPGAGATTPTQLTVTEVAPSITALSPNSGATAGSTQVQITGNRFLTATGVTFGGVPAASFTILSQTSILAVSPPGTAGTVRVAVTNSAATTPDTAADDFTYIDAPTITGISPAVSGTAGGTPVTITGTNFTGATAVSFGGNAATSFTVDSPTQITATAPAGSVGIVNVSVTTVGGTSADNSTADDFAYGVPPTATLEFLQTSIPADGTTLATVRLTLTNPNPFTVSSTSFLYTLPAELTAVDGRNVNSCGSLVVNAGGVSVSDSMSANRVCQYEVDVVSSSPGSYSLSTSNLSNPFGDGVQATTPLALTVVARPVVTAVSPAFDNVAGGKAITISGTNFTGATAVSFGGTAATGFTVNPAGTQITVNAPARAAGTVNVTVTHGWRDQREQRHGGRFRVRDGAGPHNRSNRSQSPLHLGQSDNSVSGQSVSRRGRVLSGHDRYSHHAERVGRCLLCRA